jgi:hypothetical protein
MPLTKWGKIASFEENRFKFKIKVPAQDNATIYEWTRQFENINSTSILRGKGMLGEIN